MSWRTQAKLAIRVLRQRLGDPAPLFATVFVTDRCNVRCDGCLFYENLHTDGTSRREDMATTLKILDALQAEGIPLVSYAGGEPFLREDFPEVLFAGQARGLAQLVITNAIVDAPRTVEACEMTCDAVVFSPHPPEELGGSGGQERWEAAWAGVARLRAGLKQAELVVGLTIGRHTAPRLDEILQRAADNGVDRVRFQTNFYRPQFPTSAQMNEMRRVLEIWNAREPGLIDMSLFISNLESYFGSTPHVACTADRKFNLGIYLDGTVSACCSARVPIGNVFKTPLSKMQTRPEQMRSDCFGCHRNDVIVAKRYCGA